MALRADNRIAFKFLAIATATLTVSACASWDVQNAAPTPAPGPALWRVADADTTVYIFGAADLLPPDAQWRSTAVTDALGQANQVILETDESPEAQAALGAVIQEIGLYRDGKTLREVLNTAQEAEIGAVTQSFGAPLSALDRLKPWLAGIQIGALNAQRQGYQTWSSGLAQLRADAKGADKAVSFLEPDRRTILRIINNLPEETHINMLLTAARQARDKPAQATETAPHYLAGDIEALTLMYHGEGQWADQRLYDALLVERNREWAKGIETLLENHDGVIFFAVGVGHVLGADSLQEMLKTRGIEAVRE